MNWRGTSEEALRMYWSTSASLVRTIIRTGPWIAGSFVI